MAENEGIDWVQFAKALLNANSLPDQSIARIYLVSSAGASGVIRADIVYFS